MSGITVRIAKDLLGKKYNQGFTDEVLTSIKIGNFNPPTSLVDANPERCQRKFYERQLVKVF